MTQNSMLTAIRGRCVIGGTIDPRDISHTRDLDEQLIKYKPTGRIVDPALFSDVIDVFRRTPNAHMPYIVFAIREVKAEQFISDSELRQNAYGVLRSIDIENTYAGYSNHILTAKAHVLGPWLLPVFELMDQLGIHAYWQVYGSAMAAEFMRSDRAFDPVRFVPSDISVVFWMTSPEIKAAIAKKQTAQIQDAEYVRHRFMCLGQTIVLTYRDLEFSTPAFDGLDFRFTDNFRWHAPISAAHALETRTLTVLKPVPMSLCEKYRGRGFNVIVPPGTITSATVTPINADLYVASYANCLVDAPTTHVDFVGMKMSASMPFPCTKVMYTYRQCSVNEGTFLGARFDSCTFKQALLTGPAIVANSNGFVDGHVINFSGCASIVYRKTLGPSGQVPLDIYDCAKISVTLVRTIDVCVHKSRDISLLYPAGSNTEARACRISASTIVNIGAPHARALLSNLEIIDSNRVSVNALDIATRKIENSPNTTISVIRLRAIKMPPSPEDEQPYLLGTRYAFTLPGQKCAHCTRRDADYAFSCQHPLCKHCVSTLVDVLCPVCK